MQIIEMLGDGNCLFRAVSHQIYGSSEHHLVVRVKCMQYIAQHKDYFHAFIVDEDIL